MIHWTPKLQALQALHPDADPLTSSAGFAQASLVNGRTPKSSKRRVVSRERNEKFRGRDFCEISVHYAPKKLDSSARGGNFRKKKGQFQPAEDLRFDSTAWNFPQLQRLLWIFLGGRKLVGCFAQNHRFLCVFAR